MATLKDVQYSLTGEPKTDQPLSVAEQGIVNDLQLMNDPLSNQKMHIFKLAGNTRRGGVHISGIDDVYNPETKKMERVRLLTGVDTIWVKEQKDVNPDYVKQNLRSLKFERGTKMLRIPDYDHTALEFARVCNHNIGNKNKKTGSKFEFYEYDPAREQKEAFEREEFELNMAIEAKQQPEETMRKHAAFLGVRLIDDLGYPKTADGLRREYIIYAKRNPKYFQETLGSKQVEVAWLVKKAILESKIEIGREPGKIYWANGGGMICHLPSGEHPERYLTNLALTPSQDGQTFKEQLQRLGT